jgi:hypothetical protein
MPAALTKSVRQRLRNLDPKQLYRC